jgi:hypothetical protein
MSVTASALVTVTVRREGFLRWSWEARAPLTRARRQGSLMLMPLPDHPTLVGEGFTWTQRGAYRAGLRAVERS